MAGLRTVVSLVPDVSPQMPSYSLNGQLDLLAQINQNSKKAKPLDSISCKLKAIIQKTEITS